MKEKSIQVSVIIINYNTDELTLAAVKSVFEFVTNVTFEIIVVDNDSKETQLAQLLFPYKNTYFYKLERNIGFGKANNFGFSKAEGEFIFLLNSDAYLIERNTLSTFMDYLNLHPDVACVGGNLVTADKKPNICHGKFLSVERMLHDFGIKKVTPEYFNSNLATAQNCNVAIPTQVDHLTGAAIMIRRQIIERYGLFNPAYFMYLEDMELCYRYRKYGFLSIIMPDVKLVHLGGQSSINDSEVNKRIVKEIAYSRYLFLQNVTSWPIAIVLYITGILLTFYKRVRNKIRKIVYAK
jgi:GT2 family glycosyltransferase